MQLCLWLSLQTYCAKVVLFICVFILKEIIGYNIIFVKSPSAVPNPVYHGEQMLTRYIYKLYSQFCISPSMDNILYFYSCKAMHGGC